MKKLLFILFLAPFAGFGQNCSQQKDPKTGKMVHTGLTVLKDSTGKENAAVGFTKLGSQASLTTGAPFKTTNVRKNAVQMQLVVTFADGSTKRFTGNKHTQLIPEPGGVAVVFLTNLTTDEVAYFGKHAIVSETFYYAGDQTNGLTFRLSPADGEIVMQSVTCIAD
jgi:hypothetical protein